MESVGIMVGEQPLKRTTVAEYLEQTESALNALKITIDVLGAVLKGAKPCGNTDVCLSSDGMRIGIIEQAEINNSKAQLLLKELAELVELL